MKPQEVSDAMLIFPADVSKMMPVWEDIPKEFRVHNNTEWEEIVSQWFHKGLPEGVLFYPKVGIDGEMAFRHIKTILGSFQPKHEHKMAAVAFLMSEWFEKVENWKK